MEHFKNPLSSTPGHKACLILIHSQFLRCFRWMCRQVLFLRGEGRPDSKLPGRTGTGSAETSSWEFLGAHAQECRLPAPSRAGCLLHALSLSMRKPESGAENPAFPRPSRQDACFTLREFFKIPPLSPNKPSRTFKEVVSDLAAGDLEH